MPGNYKTITHFGTISKQLLNIKIHSLQQPTERWQAVYTTAYVGSYFWSLYQFGVQLGSMFLSLTQQRKEVSHLWMTCCLLFPSCFPELLYTFRTLNNIFILHTYESLRVVKKESRIRKAIINNMGPYHFQYSNELLPEKYYWKVTPCPTQSILSRHYVYPVNSSH